MDATHIADWLDDKREKGIDAAKRNPLIGIAGFVFLGVVLFFALRSKKPEEKKGTTKVIKIIRERLVKEDKDMSRRDPKDDTRNADEIAADEAKKAAEKKAADEKAAADKAAEEKAAAEKAAAEKAEKENKS
jgi:hypothetical protein